MDPVTLGWCVQELDTLSEFLDQTNAKGFIILHRGRIAYEEYFDSFAPDSVWYWASAGKSLTAVLVGMAEEQDLLSINDKTSDYLGSGWTSAPQNKEDLITIKDQLQMTTGLDYTVPDLNCLSDSCLLYKNDAGTYWFYHNAPYRLLQDVVESASGKAYNQFTFEKMTPIMGITGLWINYVFYSNARSMARFGLLALSDYEWGSIKMLNHPAYIQNMTQPSQSYNEAYGYLWWLNGQSTYRQPGIDFPFNGPIIPSAPADLYMAAGKNEQRIYIVPSEDLVVVRIGEAADQSLPALSGFDTDLWKLMSDLMCKNTGIVDLPEEKLSIYPNPASEYVEINPWSQGDRAELWSMSGQKISISGSIEKGRFTVRDIPQGLYLLKVYNKEGVHSTRLNIY
ncbi:MAG: serine hydrolase [Owenweeksia sp.]